MTATLTPLEYAVQQTPYNGTIRWARRFGKSSFNDIACGIELQALGPFYALGQIGLSACIVYLKSTTSGAGHPWGVYARFGSLAQYATLGLFESTAAAYKRQTQRYEFTLPYDETLRVTSPTTNIFLVEDHADPATAHTADNMEIVLEGWASPAAASPANPDIVPVSVRDVQVWPWRR